MKQAIYFFGLLLNLAFSQTDSIPSKDIPNNIFPQISGRIFQYTGYLTILDTETKVSGTDSAGHYSTIWTIGNNTPLAAVYGSLASVIPKPSATLIFDTTRVQNFYGGPKFSPLFMYYDSTGNDYYFLINIGLFFRYSLIKDSSNAVGIRKDSLQFIKIASPKAGIGGEFTSFQRIFTTFSNPAAPASMDFRISGRWESKLDITTNGKVFTSYYLIISRVIKVGTTTVSGGTMAKFWFVENVGPVKMFLAGDAENNGHFRELKNTNFLTTIVEQKELNIHPAMVELKQNYPNPFNPETNIEYSLSDNSFVTLKVFDVLGKEIVTLVYEHQKSGKYAARFETKGLPSGFYFYRLKTEKSIETKKMILLR